ncbi:MAG: hypothetical protein ACR2II_06490 [Chthoniobacterales bacterium]
MKPVSKQKDRSIRHPASLILRMLCKTVAGLTLFMTLMTAAGVAQELPRSGEDSFEVEPPMLLPPQELTPESGAHGPAATVETLQERLASSKESAASAQRLVKKGILAKVEAEQRALRVLRLESQLADAQLAIAQEQVEALKKRLASGESVQSELDAATASLTPTIAAAQTAKATCERARLAAAALNLKRQRQLFAQGSARKTDVARAEEKLAALHQSTGSSAQAAPSP